MKCASVKHYWLAVAVVMSLIGSGVSWSQDVVTTPCTLTTNPPAKPTNFTATVNEEGIQLRWDAPPEADKVFSYEIFRGVGSGTTPTIYGTMDVESVYDANSDTLVPSHSVTTTVDYNYVLTVAETYVYAIAFGRWNNCGGYQEGIKSDSVTVTYQPDE